MRENSGDWEGVGCFLLIVIFIAAVCFSEWVGVAYPCHRDGCEHVRESE